MRSGPSTKQVQLLEVFIWMVVIIAMSKSAWWRLHTEQILASIYLVRSLRCSQLLQPKGGH